MYELLRIGVLHVCLWFLIHVVHNLFLFIKISLKKGVQLIQQEATIRIALRNFGKSVTTPGHVILNLVVNVLVTGKFSPYRVKNKVILEKEPMTKLILLWSRLI